MSELMITLPDALQAYVEEQVASGKFETTSEYLRQLVADDQKRKAQQSLENLLLDGLASGEPIAVTPEFWQQLWGRVNERASQTSLANGMAD